MGFLLGRGNRIDGNNWRCVNQGQGGSPKNWNTSPPESSDGVTQRALRPKPCPLAFERKSWTPLGKIPSDVGSGANGKKKKNSQMPRHLISDAHEWINEIPTVPTYYLANPQAGERACKQQRGKKTLLRMLYKYSKGPCSLNLLDRLDQRIRTAVKRWLHLPRTISTALLRLSLLLRS